MNTQTKADVLVIDIRYWYKGSIKMKTLGKILIAIGILGALVIAGRALFYAPNDATEDSGLQVTGSAINSVTPKQLPTRLLIPKLGIDTKVQHLGVTKTGNMAAPNNFTDVSWYKFGTVPGQLGSSVIAGHVDNALGTPAIFYNLKDLEVDDDVYVTDASGKKLHFKVFDKQVYQYDKAPAEKIFNDKSGKYLNLITCQGEWVPAAKSAKYRLVVYTKLVE